MGEVIKRFWDTEEGKIVSYGMHEHGGATCNIGANIQLLQMRLEKGNLSNEELKDRLEKMSNSLKKADDAVDYIYTKFKERHGKV